jgi:chromosome segregation protein
MGEAGVHIKSAKLKNFLSFYEGIVEFDEGLTVIVGPNGSGKTSIFHALKFALGSNQREKRYSKWSDFIRHGSNSSEVEIKVQANGHSHTFLRKIQRDGIPRAYVDGKRVRAAELRAVVESLGIDVDNTLVFMPQERINAIRGMDPIEICKLIEEGTDLSYIRDRIFLQEANVNQSKKNLDDVLSESRIVERELQLLQHDVMRLKKKRELQEQLRVLKSELKWATLDDLTKQIERIRKDITTRESGLEKVLVEQGELESQIDEEETRALELNNQLVSQQREIGKLEARIEEEGRKLQRLEDENARTVSEIQRLENEIKGQRKQKDKLQIDSERIARTKEKYTKKRKELLYELEVIEEELDKVELDLTEYSEWNTKRAHVHGEYKALQAEMQGKDLLIRSLNERLQLEKVELESIENRWSHSWTAIEDIDQKELVTKKSQLEKQITQLNEQRFSQNSIIAQIQKQLNEIETKIEESTHRIPESVLQLMDAIKDHQLSTIHGPLCEMVKVEKELQVAIESIFYQDIIYAFFVETKADFTLIRKLRDKVGAPSPIILLSSDNKDGQKHELPKGKGIIGWLWDSLNSDNSLPDTLRRIIGNIVLVQDNRTAVHVATKYEYGAVSLDGFFVMPQNSGIISYPKHESKGVLSVGTLQEQLDSLQKDLAIERKKTSEIEIGLDKASEEREKIADLLAEITSWAGTWQRRKTLSESIPELEARISKLTEDFEILSKKVTKAQKKLRTLDNTQPPERSRLIGQKSAIKMKQRRLQRELSDLESKVVAAEKDENSKKIELEHLEDDILMLSSRLKELKQELRSSKNSSSTILATIDTISEGLDKTKESQKTTEEDLSKINEQIRKLRERLVELNLIARTSRVEVLQAKKQMDNIQNDINSLKAELSEETRPTQIREFKLVQDNYLRVQHILADYEDVSENIARTESELQDRLGLLETKVTELQEEVKEAENAVKDIREQYLNGMNETLRELEKIVHDILQGVGFNGEVKFNLVRNNGTYGVEFKSKIRGEQFKGLSAGSGGERSLIAISLIIAMQRKKPAPVYAMDEIDIFLDATNTEMVSKLLYDSSRHSQFLLFTPAKSTLLLKHADKRVGVVSPGGVEPSVIIESPQFLGQ